MDLGLINDKRQRHSFKTSDEVNTFAELKTTERQDQGVAAPGLRHEIKVDAAKASAILKPHGVSLEEVANRTCARTAPVMLM